MIFKRIKTPVKFWKASQRKKLIFVHMKSIKIQAKPFFELLKNHDKSMWDIFAEMIDGEEKEIIFADESGRYLFSYVLPETLEKMRADKDIFVHSFEEKLKASQN